MPRPGPRRHRRPFVHDADNIADRALPVRHAAQRQRRESLTMAYSRKYQNDRDSVCGQSLMAFRTRLIPKPIALLNYHPMWLASRALMARRAARRKRAAVNSRWPRNWRLAPLPGPSSTPRPPRKRSGPFSFQNVRPVARCATEAARSPSVCRRPRRPLRAANIFARTSGYIEKLYVDIGDRVKAGALLADITAPEL